jgi:hypothetical protein
MKLGNLSTITMNTHYRRRTLFVKQKKGFKVTPQSFLAEGREWGFGSGELPYTMVPV